LENYDKEKTKLKGMTGWTGIKNGFDRFYLSLYIPAIPVNFFFNRFGICFFAIKSAIITLLLEAG
jgi:hypothetical protein